MDLTETTISSENIYKGRVVNLRVDTVRLADGTVSSREVVEHRCAVAIVALLDANTLLLVRQYRTAVGRTLLELPAGTLEPNEPIEECAKRELAEETGYRAGRLDRLFTQYLAPGYSQEALHVFLATELTPGEQKTDHDERLEVERVSVDEVAEMVFDGRICDSKSIAGILATLRRLGR